MRLFKILTKKKYGKHYVTRWQTLDSIPPISVQINPGFLEYGGDQYIIDIDFTPDPVCLRDIFMIYKKQLIEMLTKERFL